MRKPDWTDVFLISSFVVLFGIGYFFGRNDGKPITVTMSSGTYNGLFVVSLWMLFLLMYPYISMFVKGLFSEN